MDKDIDYVIAVAECRSISKAAELLYISQPSLSCYISKLEQDLELKLFSRTGFGVSLTEAGEVYVSYAKEIKGLQSTMARKLHQMKLEEHSRQISVCMTLNTGTLLTGQIAEEFRKKYAGVQLEFINVMSKDIQRRLEERKCDFAIGPDVCDHNEYAYDLITREHFLLAVPVKYDLDFMAEHVEGFQFPWIDITHLPKVDFILQEASCNVRKHIDLILNRYGIAMQPVMEVTNSILTIQAAERQLGCCFLSESFLPYITNRDSLRCYCVGEPDDASTSGAIYARDRQLTAPEKYCIACIGRMLVKSKDRIREEFLKGGV
ncbi:MAG: LysR family transcriptional regulator [Hungatella sp.]|nr:LysR family transcriptional regulator [Hungatella sp.]